MAAANLSAAPWPGNGYNCKNITQALQAKLKAASSPASIWEVEAQITVLQAQQHTLETDHQDYTLRVHALRKRDSSLSPQHR